MHTWFRQYAQQMGMQNVRAILPEQIDVCINTAIDDAVNQLIRENIGITQDRTVTDNSKIGQVNALRTLYKVVEVPIANGNVFEFSAAHRRVGKLVSKNNLLPKFLYEYLHDNNLTGDLNIGNEANEDFVNPVRFYVDFSISYKCATSGFIATSDGINMNVNWGANGSDNEFAGDETTWFPVRLIDDIYLADSLQDFVLKNRLRSPILTIYNNSTFELYTDVFKKNGSEYIMRHNLIPFMFRVTFVKKPNRVEFNEDVNDNSIDCDLPEYMHVDILKHAVDLYRAAVAGSVMSAEGQQRAAQVENVRNNTIPMS